MSKTPLAKKIDQYLRSYGSPLAGLGGSFVQAGEKYGVDPRMLVGITIIESSGGKALALKNNPFNWGVHSGKTYPSMEASIMDVARGLREGYLDDGLKTPQQIVSRYAPAADSNNESNWANVVSGVISKLGGAASYPDLSDAENPAVPSMVTSDLLEQYPTPSSPFDAMTVLRAITDGGSPFSALQHEMARLMYADAPSLYDVTPPAQPDQADPSTPQLSPGQLQATPGHLNPKMAALAQKYGLTVTSGYRTIAEQAQLGGVAAAPGKSYHNFGRAIDVAPDEAAMQFVEYARANPGLFREVFYDVKGHSIYIKDGKLYPGRILGGHDDHVHIAR